MTQTLESIFFHGDDQQRYDHTPGSAVSQGEIVQLGKLVGCCTSPEGISASTLGSVATAGVFKIKKAVSAGVTFAIGDIVEWDDTNNTAVAQGSGDFDIGECVEVAAADADDHVVVAINRQGLN